MSPKWVPSEARHKSFCQLKCYQHRGRNTTRQRSPNYHSGTRRATLTRMSCFLLWAVMSRRLFPVSVHCVQKGM